MTIAIALLGIAIRRTCAHRRVSGEALASLSRRVAVGIVAGEPMSSPLEVTLAAGAAREGLLVLLSTREYQYRGIAYYYRYSTIIKMTSYRYYRYSVRTRMQSSMCGHHTFDSYTMRPVHSRLTLITRESRLPCG